MDIFFHFMTPEFKKRLWRVLVIVGISICALVLLLFLSAFDHPSADDFCYANQVYAHGFWETQSDLYQQWSGRYFSNFLVSAADALLLAHSASIPYGIVPITILLLFVFSLWYCINAIAGSFLDAKSRILYTCVFALLYWSTLPSLSEGLYWVPGALTYSLGSILLLVAIGMGAQYVRSADRRCRWVTAIGLLATEIALIGLNEIALGIVVCFLGIMFIIMPRIGLTANRFLVILGVVGVGACVVEVIAPGN